LKAFLYRVCAIFFSHFVLYPDYRISFFIPLAFRFADYTSLSFCCCVQAKKNKSKKKREKIFMTLYLKRKADPEDPPSI